MEPTPVLLPGKFHGQSNLEGYSPRGCKKLTQLSDLHATNTAACHSRESTESWLFLGPSLTTLVAQRVKNSACNAGDMDLIPGSGKIPWRRK